MKRLKFFAFVFIAFSMIGISCSKGTAGPQGPPGPSGTGSVTYSAWTTLEMTYEGTDSATGDSVFYETITASAITQTILDSGIILGYLSFVDNTGATNVVNAAPFFSPELFLLGGIELTSYGTDWSGYNYRYVVIPGSILTTNSILKNYTKTQLKTVDYSVVSKALGMTDNKSSN